MSHFFKDLWAGLTTGIIDIALAIARFMITLTGGSRCSISGPTAVFAVILYPVANKFGLTIEHMPENYIGKVIVLIAVLIEPR